MANNYKNIVITPNRDTLANDVPFIRFSGGDATLNTDINLRVYTTQSGTISFEGSAGQLFSITNDLTNTIFSVNDVSGIPSIEVDANGLVKLAEFGGNVAIGRSNALYKLDVVGTINASNVLINGNAIATIQGLQGLQGRQGLQGTDGIQGRQGLQGTTGTATQGIQGTTGTATQGIQGTTGTATQGIQGTTGTATQGIQGIQGRQGIQGANGFQGTTGTATQGIQGTTGTATQGLQGTTGTATQGIQGTTGTATQGLQGTTGTATQGLQGTTGTATQGIQGLQGFQGFQGTTGTATQGIQGIQGVRGASAWTPNFSGGVTQSSTDSQTYTKTSGTNGAWDGQVYSTQGYVRGVYATARASQTNAPIMFGLNSDPTTDASFASMDYAIYFLTDGTVQIYENSSLISSHGAYTTSSVLTITYDGVNVRYYRDSTLLRTVARAIGNALYFDSSFYNTGTSLNSVGFGPMGEGVQGIQGTTGTATQGIQGTTGTATQGIQGTTGTATQGIQGTTGTATQGIQGITGTATQGIQGTTGTATQGIQGTTGTATQGIQGITGTATQGIQGLQGFQGLQGITGPSTLINATSVTVNDTVFPVFVTDAGSNQTAQTSPGFIYNPSSNNLTISGNLGIGTVNPGYRLDIVGTGDVTGAITSSSGGAGLFRLIASSAALAAFNQVQSINGSTINWSIGGEGSVNTFAIKTGSTERMRIDATGNVGVGTGGASTLYRFHVQRPSGPATYGEAFWSDGSYYTSINSRQGAGAWNPLVQAGDHTIHYSDGTIDTGAIVIGPWSATMKGIRIDLAGNVLINRTTSTVGLNTKLDINGAVNASAFLVNGVAVGSGDTASLFKRANIAFARAITA